MRARVDVWELQRELMAASGQAMPERATLGAVAVLYLALLTEELSETLVVAARVVIPPGRVRGEALIIGLCFTHAAAVLHSVALEIRRNLGEMAADGRPFPDIALTMEQAKELLDGTTDIAVVNAGFALAAGLPGPEGYLEVAGSNLSKRNPDTGVIDKDASGKWIKGRDYVAPNLEAVLHRAGSVE